MKLRLCSKKFRSIARYAQEELPLKDEVVQDESLITE
jgi:hypothetical protein